VNINKEEEGTVEGTLLLLFGDKCEALLFITSVVWLVFVFFWLNIAINYFR
jgi:hypothetical protein